MICAACICLVFFATAPAKEMVASRYSPVVMKEPFDKTMERMPKAKPGIMKRQMKLLEVR